MCVIEAFMLLLVLGSSGPNRPKEKEAPLSPLLHVLSDTKLDTLPRIEDYPDSVAYEVALLGHMQAAAKAIPLPTQEVKYFVVTDSLNPVLCDEGLSGVFYVDGKGGHSVRWCGYAVALGIAPIAVQVQGRPADGYGWFLHFQIMAFAEALIYANGHSSDAKSALVMACYWGAIARQLVRQGDAKEDDVYTPGLMGTDIKLVEAWNEGWRIQVCSAYY